MVVLAKPAMGEDRHVLAITKTVTKFAGAAHVLVPKEWLGWRVAIFPADEWTGKNVVFVEVPDTPAKTGGRGKAGSGRSPPQGAP